MDEPVFKKIGVSAEDIIFKITGNRVDIRRLKGIIKIPLKGSSLLGKVNILVETPGLIVGMTN